MSKKKKNRMTKQLRMSPGPHVLVGFGKHDLVDLIYERGTPEGEERLLYAMDKYHWPPRFRLATSCTVEEVYAFKEYVELIKSKLIKGDE